MIKGIIAITGKPGLYRLLKRGRNALIVENLETGKRAPSYGSDKVISLADVTMYSDHGDVPLPEVLDNLYRVQEGKPVDIKGMKDDEAFRELFGRVVPDYERDRVYVADMRKLYTWYNILIAAGVTEFKDKEIAQDQAAEAAEAADAENTVKE